MQGDEERDCASAEAAYKRERSSPKPVGVMSPSDKCGSRSAHIFATARTGAKVHPEEHATNMVQRMANTQPSNSQTVDGSVSVDVAGGRSGYNGAVLDAWNAAAASATPMDQQQVTPSTVTTLQQLGASGALP